MITKTIDHTKTLKVGIIGLGVGEQHIAGFESHPDCEVVSLCDFSKEKREEVSRRYPDMEMLKSAEGILEDPRIDVVSIATYDSYHFEQIIKGIQNYKHLFVEKPFCTTEDQARHIRDLLREKPYLKISSNLILRKSPRFQLLKTAIDKGEFGNLYYVEGDYNYGRLEKLTEGWRGKMEDYSIVQGGGVHLIDLLMWLTNDEVVEVSAYGNRIATKGSRFKSDDLIVSLLRFKSGAIGKIACNFGCVHPHFHPVSLYGTKKTFINGMDKGLFFDSSDPAHLPIEMTAAYPGVHKGGLIYRFIKAILEESEPIVSSEDIFKTMSVCFAIEKAAKTSGPVKVEYI